MTEQALSLSRAPTLANVIADCTRGSGDRAFLMEGDRCISYREADAQSRHLALGLLAAGAGKGTRVGIIMPNSPDWVLAWLAAGRMGAVTLPLSTFFQAREMDWALKAADIDTLLISAGFLGHDYLERLERALPGLDRQTSTRIFLPSHPYLRRIVVWGETDRPWATKGPAALFAAADAEPILDDAFLSQVEANVVPADLLVGICTSGSTAEPKIVMHTHGTMVRATRAFWPYQDIVADDRNYSGMPFFWIGGLNVNLLPVMYAGACMVFAPSPRVDDILDVVVQERVTRISMWKPQVAALLERAQARKLDLSFVRTGLFEPKDRDGVAIPASHRTFGSMGMTESFGMHSIEKATAILPEARRGSSGHGLQGIERKVVDPMTGETLPPGATGELYIRGYTMLQSYYKRERGEIFTEDGFFATGDLVSIDEAGYIYPKGRHTEMIKTSGANVAPVEVENLLQMDGAVREAIVFGVPDPIKGEIVVAVVIARDGATVDVEILRRHLMTEISAYKVPQRIEVMGHDEIPRTDAGKPRKNILKQMVIELPVQRFNKNENGTGI